MTGVLGAAVCILLVSVGVLAVHGRSSSELVRIRHALLFSASRPGDFDWTPERYPADFLRETASPPPYFQGVIAALDLAKQPSHWDRLASIGCSMLRTPQQRQSPPIRKGLEETHRRIVSNGEGYCGDVVPVFIALALAAGMEARAWAFSTDGVAGRGHIWAEVWNPELSRWQLVDIYNNVYFHRGDGVAVSALEFRQALMSKPAPALHRSLFCQGAAPGYEIEATMWAYYRAGLASWFLVWGNNVFSYDRAFPIARLQGMSNTLAQAVAVAVGVYPRIKLLSDRENANCIQSFLGYRKRLLIALYAAMAAVIVILSYIIGRMG